MRGHELNGPRAAYSEAVRSNLPFGRRLSGRILAEIDDHLSEATESLVERGLSRSDAEREAIQRFGDPDLVAVTFARSRGMGMTTITTRSSGLAAMLLPVSFLAGVMMMSYDGLGDPGHWVGSGLLVLAFCQLLFFMFGLWKRHAGRLGMWGRSAMFIAVVSPIASLPFAWGAGVALIGYLAIAFILLTIGVWKADEVPKVPMVLLALGPFSVIATGLFGRIVGFDGALFFGFGIIPVVAGLMRLGYFLWSETEQEEEPTGGTPTFA